MPSGCWTPPWSLQPRLPGSSHPQWAPFLVGVWSPAEHLFSLALLSFGGGSYHQCTPGAYWIAYILLCWASSRHPHEDQGLWKRSSSYLSVEGLIHLFFLVRWTIADTHYNVTFGSSWRLPYYLCSFLKEITSTYMLMLIFSNFTFFSKSYYLQYRPCGDYLPISAVM